MRQNDGIETPQVVISVRVNILYRLNAMINDDEKVEFCKGVMYIYCSINGKVVMVLVNFEATYNVINIMTTKRLG